MAGASDAESLGRARRINGDASTITNIEQYGIKKEMVNQKARWIAHRQVGLLAVLVLAGMAGPTMGQTMPRQDVIDVPAVQDGLCLSNVFQSNMVLQREKPIHVWGWAEPGEQVTVRLGSTEATSTAAEDRSWKVTLPARPADAVPQTMTVQGAESTLQLENLLIGDVWVLGGQSNMEFELAKVENGQLEIASAHQPQIRILTVPYAEGPAATAGFPRLHEWSDWFGRHFRKGDWDVCTPEVARELSAIGYVFARRVQQASQIPIGVIDASRGGTTVEAWTPLAGLQEIESPAVQAKLAKSNDSVAAWDAQADLEKRVEQHRKWIAQQQEQGKEIPDDRKVEPTDLRPGPIADPNYPGNCYAGMIHPLAGLSVKGVIFHQGFNNAFDGSAGVQLYRDTFPVMIESWRTAFDDPELPFGILSLCTDGYPQTLDDYCEKMFNAGIGIRAAQYETFLDLQQEGDENVGFVSTYDLRRRWYHPQLKLPAGERIARWALSTEYGFGRQLPWKPPAIETVSRQDGALVVQFDTEVGDPQDGAIRGFAIAGEDRRFHPAEAAYAEKGKDDRGRVQYDRRRLVLTSIMVENPTEFRYAWGRNPLANLQATGNKDLPVATQRSDDWIDEEVPLGVFENEVELPISRGDRGKILQTLREQDRTRRLRKAQRTLEELGQQ